VTGRKLNDVMWDECELVMRVDFRSNRTGGWPCGV